MYLDVSDKLGKKVGIHLPVLMWSIEEQEVVKNKSEILKVAKKVEKVWILSLIVTYGVAVNLEFDSEFEAKKYLEDKVINA